MTRWWRGAALGAMAAVIGTSTEALAQRVHVLAVSGLPGEARFRAPFAAAARTLADSARAKWGVADSSLVVLADSTVAGPGVTGRSTREEIAAAFLRLARRAAPGDVVLVFLNGHGSGEGLRSRVSLPGPDATAADFVGWLAGLARQTVVFVNAASGSGDFVAALAGPGRVVVTATRTAIERNETTFADPFVRALTGTEADADKDGQVSVLEAFALARQEVARAYERDDRMLTEHATLSDSVIARAVRFGRPAPAASAATVALVAERQGMEAEVAALRARKASMEPAAYEDALEAVLVRIAEKARAIRAAGAAAPPTLPAGARP